MSIHLPIEWWHVLLHSKAYFTCMWPMFFPNQTQTVLNFSKNCTFSDTFSSLRLLLIWFQNSIKLPNATMFLFGKFNFFWFYILEEIVRHVDLKHPLRTYICQKELKMSWNQCTMTANAWLDTFSVNWHTSNLVISEAESLLLCNFHQKTRWKQKMASQMKYDIKIVFELTLWHNIY